MKNTKATKPLHKINYTNKRYTKHKMVREYTIFEIFANGEVKIQNLSLE